MPSVTIGPNGHEVISDDGSVHIKSEATPGYINSFRIEERWVSTGDELDDSAIRAILSQGLARQYSDWHTFVSPYFSGDIVKEAIHFNGLLKKLGYKLDTQYEVEEDGRAHRVKDYKYPSIERVNDFMAAVFDEDVAVEFVPYEGTEYSAYEFVDKFAREGKVLIATHQPHEVHDLSDHTLGWIGLTPGLVKILRERLKPYLNRFEAEYEAPAVPVLQANGEDERVQEFMYPSLKAIKVGMRKLDTLTSRIAEKAMFKTVDMCGGRPRSVASAIENFFDSSSYGVFRGFNLPSGLFGDTPNCLLLAHDILDRYEQASQ